MIFQNLGRLSTWTWEREYGHSPCVYHRLHVGVRVCKCLIPQVLHVPTLPLAKVPHCACYKPRALYCCDADYNINAFCCQHSRCFLFPPPLRSPLLCKEVINSTPLRDNFITRLSNSVRLRNLPRVRLILRFSAKWSNILLDITWTR